MKDYWHLLFEKFSEGALSDQQERDLCDLHKTDEAFRAFWLKASGQVSLMATLKETDDLESFLSSTLFLDQKIRRRGRKKPLVFTFLKVAAALVLLALPSYVFFMKDKLPEISLSTSGISEYNFLFANEVKIGDEAVVLKFKEATVSILGPAKARLNFDGSFEMKEGVAHIITNPGFNFPVETPFRTYQDIGTEFGLKIKGAKSEVHVFDGSVQVGESVVETGKAMLSEGVKDLDVSVDRGGFFNESQLGNYIDSADSFREQRVKILNSPHVFEYFDFSTLKSASGELSGLKGSSIKIKSEVKSLVSGPHFGSKALRINNDGDYLSFSIPRQILENYSIYVNFYYEEYTLKPQKILTDESGSLKLSQTMSWFKKAYWKDGFMGEAFWRYRGLLLVKGINKTAFSNLEDVTVTKELPGNYSNDFTVGNSKKLALNFKGRISSIVILKSTDVKVAKALFYNSN